MKVDIRVAMGGILEKTYEAGWGDILEKKYCVFSNIFPHPHRGGIY
jgi:hypothetical protein